jgi:hypothetical protein
MTVAIVAGAEGVGKTLQLLGVAKEFQPAVFGILELKDKSKIMALESEGFKPEVLLRLYPDGEKKQGGIDSTRTLEAIEQWRDKIYTEKSSYKTATIIIDGISDLRSFAEDAWIDRNNKALQARGENPRKSVGKNNISGWAEINNIVKDILMPLINLALKDNLNLLMSAQMKDVYRNGEVVGTAPDYKPWLAYPVPCLFQLEYGANAYNLKCLKEPENPRWSVDGIKKNTGLLDALRGHNLIEPGVINYMIRYDEDGETKRTFIKAQTEEKAREGFEKGNPNAVITEVMK